MPTADTRNRPLPAVVLAAAVTVFIVVRPPDLPGLRRVEDFGAFWAAARLNVCGGNPYSTDDLRPVQQAIDPARTHILYIFNPPWTLGLLLPLARLDFLRARLLWMAIEVALLLGTTAALWRRQGGSPQGRVVAWALAFTFFPTLQLLALGQMTVLTLAGAVGFVLWEKKHPWIAGMAAGLTLIKPHLVVVLWVPLGLWCLQRRRWPVLAGAAGTTLALAGLAWICNPRVLGQYAAMWGHNPAASWVPPTPGSLLRLLLGSDRFWLAFVFPALGVAWAAARWWRRRHRWDWVEELPVLLLGCFLTAAYGWAYDLVILLPALLGSAAAVRTRPAVAAAALAAYVALDGLAVAMNVARCEEYLFFWIAPAVLAGTVLLRRTAAAAGAGDIELSALDVGQSGSENYAEKSRNSGTRFDCRRGAF
jgi:hypothetical protein